MRTPFNDVPRGTPSYRYQSVPHDRLIDNFNRQRGSVVQFAQARERADPESVHAPWSPRLKGTQYFESFLSDDLPYENPDTLSEQKGIGIYTKMLQGHDMCRASFMFLCLACISPGHEITPGADDSPSKRAAEFQKEQLRRMRGTASQMQLNILRGAFRGFSLLELIWAERMRRGDWRGKQMIGQLQDKNPEYIRFKTDSAGQVEKKGVWQLEWKGGNTYTKVALDDVVYWAFDPINDNPYGTPLAKAAHPYYFASTFGLKHWLRFLEKFGHPIIQGKMKRGKVSDTDKDVYLEMLGKLWSNLVAVIWDDMDTELIQPDYVSTDQYEKMLRFCNRAIARCMLLPSEVMEHEGAVGSLALAKEHGSEGQFLWVLDYLAEELCNVINEQWIRPSHVWNFGEQIPQPEFKIKSYVEENMKLRAEIYSSLSLIGMPFSVPALRREFSIPEPKPGDQVIGGRPAGGGLLDEIGLPIPKPKPMEVPVPGTLSPEAQKKAQKLQAQATEIAFARARGEPFGRTHYSFSRSSPPPSLEEYVPFDETLVAEDLAAEYWGEIAAVVLEDHAEAVAEKAGKGNGTQPHE